MQITFDREKLLAGVKLIKNITINGSKMPVLSTIKFDIKSNLAELTATDLELTAITTVPCKCAAPGPGCFLIHGRTLHEILANMKAQEVVMEVPVVVEYGTSTLAITKGKTRFNLPLIDPDEFPEIKDISPDGDDIVISADEFIRSVRRTLYAASSDDSRFALTGLYMELKQGTFVMAGTDGFRIALSARRVAEGGNRAGIIIPARAMKHMADVFDDHAQIEITFDEKRACIADMTGKLTIISRVIDQKYPDYEMVLTNHTNARSGLAIMKRVDLMASLKLLRSFSDKGDVLTIRRSLYGLRLDMEAGTGTATDYIDCQYRDTTELAVSIVLKYFLDAVEHLSGEEVLLQYYDTYGMIRIDEGTCEKPDYTVGIMPVRSDIKPLLDDLLTQQPDDDPTTGRPDDSRTQQQGDAPVLAQGGEEACEAHIPGESSRGQALDDGGSNPPPATKKQARHRKTKDEG